jgi:SPP1 gp7 family putative phage head morphogenesis protein
METKFTHFLRAGGNGEFLIRREANGWSGGRTSFAIKSEFPNYAALRDSFATKLDAIIQANTAMLLQAIGPQYDPPLTATELLDVSAARADTLALWEERIEVIWTEWHSHLQRLRPIREAMEQHLLRGFAGLINELRQRGLGIRQYVWRSRDDGKVRSSHAHYDDQVFSWDDPPEGGHPGQAFNCRCHAKPYVQDQTAISPQNWDGFAFRYGDADRDQMRRNAEAEMRALRPAIEALAALSAKTADQEAQQRALAEAFRAAAYRYELASREPDALARSGLLFGPNDDRARLIAEAEAYRAGADDMARGMARSAFFEGILSSDVLNELRRSAPESAGNYLNSLVLMAAVPHLPESLLGGSDRDNVLRAIGGGFVAAARAVEQERWGGRPVIFRADVAQWDGLHGEMQAIAGNDVSPRDGQAVQNGMFEETGRRFYPEALSLVAGGLFSIIGAAARAPIRITPDILDDGGRFLGQTSGGPNARSFRTWLAKPENVVEIMPGGQVRYTTTITDPASSLNSRTVSVSYTNGAPDFSQLGVARVDIPSPVGRGVGADKADMRAASRALWREIEAGRVSRQLFTQRQLDEMKRGKDKVSGLTWHHDGTSLNPDGTGPMLLLDERAHKTFGHVGWASTINE